MDHARILAVHCGASHVAFGRFSSGPGRLVLEEFGSRNLNAGASSEEDWLAAVGAALRDLGRGGMPQGRCVVGLPGHVTFNRTCRVPAVSAWQRRKIIAFEQRQGVAAAAGEMTWSHAVLAEEPNGREIMLAVTKRRFVEDLGARFSENGLYPEAALPAWLVLRHAIGSGMARPGDELVLSVGARSSQLVGCQTGRVVACSLAVGGNTVTQKLAEDLELDYAAAEALKLRGFAAPADRPADERERAAGQRAVDHFVHRLGAEILRSPPYLAAVSSADRAPALRLTGGGARLADLPAALAGRLQMRIELWELRSRLGLDRSAPELGLGPDDGPLVDLVGLAAYAAKGAHGEGNLLPRPIRREMFARRRWPWLAAIALVVAVACAVPATILRLHAREVRRQIAEVDSALSASRQAEVNERSDLARLGEIEGRVAALRRLARGRTGWVALLGDLQERLAGAQDVWLDRLQVLTPETPELSGSPARSEARQPAGLAGPAGSAPDIRLFVAGRLFDARRMETDGGDVSAPKSASLLAALRASPLVAAVEQEHFAASQPGLVDFEITLRLAPDALF